MSARPLPFHVLPPQGDPRPLLLSIPHCGTSFPDELVELYREQFVDFPEDTDWFLPQLYEFASSIGMTTIHSHYARYVVDLNRAVDSRPLYDDGRRITGVAPSHSFAGEPLYREDRRLSDEELKLRLEAYYDPYHQKLGELLADLKNRFGRLSCSKLIRLSITYP